MIEIGLIPSIKFVIARREASGRPNLASRRNKGNWVTRIARKKRATV
jgi:hypothetical protein